MKFPAFDRSRRSEHPEPDGPLFGAFVRRLSTALRNRRGSPSLPPLPDAWKLELTLACLPLDRRVDLESDGAEAARRAVEALERTKAGV